MNNKFILLILSLSLVLMACSRKEKTCVITGKVINRPQSTQLKLIKVFEDFRSQKAVLIPIKDSTFSYEIKFKDIEAYRLAFEDELNKGAWRPITFFTTNGTVKMELHPMDDYQNNIVQGGTENQQYTDHEKMQLEVMEEKLKPYQDSMDILTKNDNYNSQIMKDLFEKLKNTKKQEDKYKMYTKINELYESGEGLSPEARKLRAEADSVQKTLQNKESLYMSNNITIPSYYTLIQSILNTEHAPNVFNYEELCTLQKKYAKQFKNHPYTQYSNEVIWRFENMKPGGDFFDFTLPDLDETEHTLSDEISGKYAFIDIWAPWCGPCISKSRAIKPVYEEYKDKDFTVVGVASKYRKLDDVKKLLEKDKYPWLTLIDKPELDSRINQHYGIETAGGGTVLLDKEGKVVLVNPSAEEVKEVLDKSL